MTTEELRELFGDSYAHIMDSEEASNSLPSTPARNEPIELNADDMYRERGIDMPLTSTVIHDVEAGTTLNIPVSNQKHNTEDDIIDVVDDDTDDDTDDTDENMSEEMQNLIVDQIDSSGVLNAINSIVNTPENNDELLPSIPKNPNVLSIKEETLRFSGTEWFSAVEEKRITLAGLGGIGSFTYFLLTRLNPSSIAIYDPDTVDSVNLAGQLYSKEMIGKNKAQAMFELCKKLSNYYTAQVYQARWDSAHTPSSIMICGFDNMLSRKQFFISWKQYVSANAFSANECLFIDGRLTLNEFQVFAITGNDKYNIERYENEFLFNDSDVEEAACTMKQTSYCASMIGSIITNIFVNFVANQSNPVVEYRVPFKTYYNSNLMFFNIEN